MKIKVLSIILCLSVTQVTVAQNYTWKDAGSAFKRSIPSATCAIIAGGADGLNQTLLHHYDRFENKFPRANPQYWNPRISWTNKYKHGIEEDGPAYFGSRTFLVATTDAYHLTRTIHRVGLFGAGLTFSLNSDAKEKRLSHKLLDAGIGLGTSYLAFSMGFNVVYGVIFK